VFGFFSSNQKTVHKTRDNQLLYFPIYETSIVKALPPKRMIILDVPCGKKIILK